MYFKILTLLLFHTLLFSSAIAQQITCKVTDQNGAPISYVNIYNEAFQSGHVSDIHGLFMLNVEKKSIDALFKLSCIGYVDKLVTLDSLRQAGAFPTIILEKETYELSMAEIKVKALKFKKRRAGVRAFSNMFERGFYVDSNEIGDEFGTIMKNDKACFIEKISMNITEVTHDSMFYEVNIYHFENGRPTKPLIEKRIFLKFLASEVNKPIELNLSDRKIKVEHDFFVSLEAVNIPENCEDYGISFTAIASGKRSMRKDFMGHWKKIKMGVSIYTKLKCLK